MTIALNPPRDAATRSTAPMSVLPAPRCEPTGVCLANVPSH